MEPIYRYLYEPIPALSSDPGLPLNVHLDDNKLSLLLKRASWMRIQNGVEHAHGYLHNSNRRFDPSLNRELLFKYYYLLAVLNFERYDTIELDTSVEQANLYFEDGNGDSGLQNRFTVLQILHGTIKGYADTLKLASQWWNANSSRSGVPLFHLSIYLGSWATHQELHEDSTEWLNRSISLAETEIDRAIVKSNLGALKYLRDDFDEAVRYYESALNEIQSLVMDDHIHELYIMISRNLEWTFMNAAAHRNEFYSPNMPRLKENDIQYANRMQSIALSYLTNEVSDQNLMSRHGFRASNNLYEANRYFNQAERGYQLIGHIQGKRGLLVDEMKNFLNAGIALNQDVLKRIALEHAVLVNDDKTIEGLLRNNIPFHSETELTDFCVWLFTCGVNRITRLGRANCIGYLADYLPEARITQAFQELWDLLNKPWSFNKEFDFRRTAIEALGRLFPRLPGEHQVTLVNRLCDLMFKGPPLVKRQVADTLCNVLSWDLFPQIEIQKLITVLMNYLDSNSPESIEYSEVMKLLMSISEVAEEKVQRKVVEFVEKKWVEGYDGALVLFLHEHLVNYTTKSSREKAVDTAIKEVQREIREESRHRYTMKAYQWGAMLAYFLPLIVDSETFHSAEKLLTNYITAANVPFDKRSRALEVIYFLLKQKKVPSLNLKLLLQISLQCLDDPTSWKGDRENPLSSTNSILAGVFRVLSQLDVPLEQAEQLTDFLMAETLIFSKDELSQVLVAMVDWARRWNRNSAVLMPIVSRLYMECRNEDERVRAAALKGLVELSRGTFKNDSVLNYVLHAVEIALSDSSRFVRYNLAHALRSLLLDRDATVEVTIRLKNVTESLKSDLSFLVRGVLSSREKVQP